MKNSEFQFKNPRVEKLEFIVNEDSKEKNKLESHIDVESKVIDEKNAIVKLDITIGDKEQFLFYLNLKISSQFYWEGIPEDQVGKFLSVNAPALLISYARPIIANMTLQAGFRPFNLPFINFTKEED